MKLTKELFVVVSLSILVYENGGSSYNKCNGAKIDILKQPKMLKVVVNISIIVHLVNKMHYLVPWTFPT